MKIIELNKSFYETAECWDELTGKQLLQVMDALYLKDYKAEQLFLKLLKILAGLTYAQFFRCKPEELEEYFYLTAFLLQADMVFTKNLLPEYKHKTAIGKVETFYGPEDYFGNLVMAEFTNTEDYYILWMESNRTDEEALHQLVATLYRPGRNDYDMELNPEGDRREPYNSNLTHHYAERFIKRWPPSVKLAIATWYDGCRRQLVANNPKVFENSSGEQAKYGLVSVMINVAEGGIFGDFDKVEKQYVHLVMIQLNEVVEKAERIEREAKSNK